MALSGETFELLIFLGLAQILVKVRNKEHQTESVIPYKAFIDTQSYYELVGQVDENGNTVDGDPNLYPQHQRKSVNVTAASVGKVAVPAFVTSTTNPLSPEQIQARREELLKQVPSPIADLEQRSQVKEEISEPLKEEAVEPETIAPQKRKYTKRIKETV